MAPSVYDSATRAFVSILLLLSRSHGIRLTVTRESPDPELTQAFRRVSRAVHPDRGGSADEAQRLNAARDKWNEARHNRRGAGRPAEAPPGGGAGGEATGGEAAP